MIQSYLFEYQSLSDAELRYMEEHYHICKVIEIMLPNLERYIGEYLSKMKTQIGAKLYFDSIIGSFKVEQKKYLNFFSEGWDDIGDDFKTFKRSLRTRCPAFSHALSSKTSVLNEWKANFNVAPPEKLYQVIKNIYTFYRSYNKVMTEEKMQTISSWEDNLLIGLIENDCYLNKVIGPGVESAILYHLDPQRFPGSYKYGIWTLYFLTGGISIDMLSGTSEFIMVKDAVISRTGIIESDHNFFFPYQVYAYYALMHFNQLNTGLRNRYSISFPNEWRFVIVSDFYTFVVNKNYGVLQTLTGNDDVLKFEISEYY